MSARRLHFFVTRPGSREVLLLKTEEGWKLPAYDRDVPENVGFDDPGPFNDWLRTRHGLDIVRRYAIDHRGSDQASSSR